MSFPDTAEVTNSTIPAPVATISSLAAHDGQTVTLRGWLYNIRSSGKLLFPTFRDGTGTIQNNLAVNINYLRNVLHVNLQPPPQA